ncbi:MAG: amidase, partial [Ktedonobacterales bacterium]|nr:amidase [Ktedonobacterales bacterium]
MEVPVTLAAAARALRTGGTTSVDLTRRFLATIAAREGTVHAFATITTERALADATRADAERRAGIDRGPLHGVPIAVKDLLMTAGIPTGAGSAVLRDHTPTEDADVVRELATAGAVLLGKTNTHEFAWGVFTPPTRNPWDPTHIAGGSSGGSAAAVAAGETCAAIGTDTGGSIRIPAACCGVTGFKPSYGRVSLRGVIPLSTSLDHVGPIARTAEDCALLMDAIAAAPWRGSHTEGIDAGTDAIRFGLLAGPWAEGVSPAVLTLVHAAAAI